MTLPLPSTNDWTDTGWNKNLPCILEAQGLQLTLF